MARAVDGRLSGSGEAARVQFPASGGDAAGGSGAEKEVIMPQDQLIRDSFEIVHEMPEAIAMLFYGRLFNLDPSLRKMFKVDMRTQSKKLMDTLAAVVDSLEHFDRMRPMLRELGRKHAVEYGVKPEHYQLVLEALLWSFGQ